MRNPFASRPNAGYLPLPLPLDQPIKGRSGSLTRRTWNVLIILLLLNVGLGTLGLYVWAEGGGKTETLTWEQEVAGGSLADSGVGEVLLGEESLNGLALADLGQEAEDRYHLLGDSLDEYMTTLTTFLQSSFPPRTSSLLIPALSAYTLPFDHPGSIKRGMLEFKTIHQTDKVHPGEEDGRVRLWKDMNGEQGWTWEFYTDEDASRWLQSKIEQRGRQSLGGMVKEIPQDDQRDSHRGVLWAWKYMKRGVMRADFFRYLVVLLEGGVYSDVDTFPLRPIAEWGKIKPEIYDISKTDGPEDRWLSSVRGSEPSVVVAIDVDVHKKMDWGQSWPRPLGICQWTLSGAPHHPIYVDAVRRVVNATRYIADQIEVDLPEKIAALRADRPEGWAAEVERIGRMIDTQQGILPIMEHTGPGLWSDAVFSYLLVRYGLTWHDLRALDHPMRIGEVLVLPITAFSPGGEPDFHANGRDDEQADVVHDFRGSWKSGGL